MIIIVNLIDIKWRLECDKMWLKFKSREFRFEDALEVVFGKKEFDLKQIKSGSKLINTIGDNGFAVHRKADYDQRVIIYRLLNPEKVSNARAIYTRVHEKGGPFTFDELVKEANASAGWNYCYTGETAVGHWTDHYHSVDVQHISVFAEDADGWTALFKISDSQIILNGVSINEPKGVGEAIHLHTDLESHLEQMDENHFQLPPYTLLDSIKRGDITSALAIAVSLKDELDWSRLIQLAKEEGLINTLGFILECTNEEAGKQVFGRQIMDKVKGNKREGTETIRGDKPIGDIRNMDYTEMENRWNVRCYQPDVFRKIALDLVR